MSDLSLPCCPHVLVEETMIALHLQSNTASPSSSRWSVLYRRVLPWLGVVVLLSWLSTGCSGNVQIITGCENCPERCLSKDGKSGQCVSCLVDTHCQTDSSPTKKCNQDNKCVCGTNQDCSQGLICAGSQGCVSCLKDSDCTSSDRPVCTLDNKCVPCKPNDTQECLPNAGGFCEPGIQTCKNNSTWGPCENAKSCQTGERCEDKKCVSNCKDECKEGNKTCTTDDETVPGKYKACVRDSEGCLVEDTQTTDCPAGQICSTGQCIPYKCPPAPCQLNKTRCFDDDNFQKCVRDSKGCPVWGAKTKCATNQKCRNSTNTCTLCEPGDKAACYTGDAKTRGKGICKDGVRTCNTNGTAYSACTGEVKPKKEECNGVDDDCNGTPDEGCDCINGKTRSCYTGKTGCKALSNGNYNCTGTCSPGVQTCTLGKWGACKGEVQPVTKEACDGKDDNCDGTPDDGCQCTPKDTQACGTDEGECKKGTQTCDNSGKWGACQGEIKAKAETCNGKDDNCDGKVDETFQGLGDTCKVGKGECEATGKKICNQAGDAVVCDAQAGTPGTEICDGKDNNCDGNIDEPFVQKDLGKDCTLGKGECVAKGKWVCNTTQDGVTCNATPGQPGTETCNGKDDNCDGSVDEGTERDCYTGTPTTTAGVGTCKKGKEQCVNGSYSGTCVGEVKPVQEVCNNQKDDDCDGSVDEQDGRALRFAGNYDRVEIPHNMAYDVGAGASFTIEMWFTFDKLGTRKIALLLNNHRTNTNYGFHIKIQVDSSKTAPQCALVWWNGGTGQQILFGDCLAAQWTHIAMVFDKSTNKLRFYKDGQVIYDQDPGRFNIAYNSQDPLPLVFGSETGQASQGDPSLRGQVASVRFSNNARYTQTGQQRFTPPCTFQADANTVGLWNLDDGGGTAVKDLSTQKNDGTIVGPTWTTGRTCNQATAGGCK
ncbi:MAG: LamG domain-containing protein [Deltaproteobacteria bacterium]|nr:MAG: LamG domain-containing protein [Deltaproteobacteria bacterium]